jgi:hypothetical protein
MYFKAGTYEHLFTGIWKSLVNNIRDAKAERIKVSIKMYGLNRLCILRRDVRRIDICCPSIQSSANVLHEINQPQYRKSKAKIKHRTVSFNW